MENNALSFDQEIDLEQAIGVYSDDELAQLLATALTASGKYPSITFTTGAEFPVYNPAGQTVWPLGFSLRENGRSGYGDTLKEAFNYEAGGVDDFLLDCQTME